MLLDAQAYFGTVTDATDTSQYSTKAIDLSVAKEIGPGEQLYVLLQVSGSALSAHALTVDLVTESDTTLDGDSVKLRQLAVFAASSAVGTMAICALDPDQINAGLRYLGLKGTASAGASGVIKGWIVSGPDAVKAYSAGSTFNT